ncbi:hypothetical protein GCM10009665_77630 [Kitasatospora nipponensis]|uniref:Uncharacterized protein n=1 Tax=Kitasatospora nipponensis TaxID=258049 RepID=A0ABN1TAF1_9ACTN
MLLENVRSLDEAVEEVREERQAKLDAKIRARSADRRERAELKAIARQGSMLARARGGRQVAALTAGGGDGQAATEPALAESADPMAKVGRSALEPAALAAAPRRTAVGSRSSSPLASRSDATDPYAGDSVDLTADDDTLSMPTLDSPFDSLERKLRAMEKRLG